MRTNRRGSGPWAAAVWFAAAFLASPGCETLVPPVPEPEPTPGSEEPEPPSGSEEPEPVVLGCESGTIHVGGPRKIRGGGCRAEYEVDFVVEGWPADSMLLDMFQYHTLRSWRVTENGDTVRHEFSLRMGPAYRGLSLPTIRSSEPVIVQRCPGGTGEQPLLVCTSVRCGIYDDVSEVPSAFTELDWALIVPPEFHYAIEMQEGETVEIPFTFRFFRPLMGYVRLPLESANLSVSEFLEVDVTPREIYLPSGTSGTRTHSVRVTVDRFDHAAASTAPEFKFRYSYDRGHPGCAEMPELAFTVKAVPPVDALTQSSR